MSELKTKQNDANVISFLNSVDNDLRKRDSFHMLDLVKKVTDIEPKMWGDSIIGFNNYTYKYASGRTGEWFSFGFSPRKQSLTVYLPVYLEKIQEMVNKVSTKTGKGCIYIKDLSKVDEQDMIDLIQYAFDKTKEL